MTYVEMLKELDFEIRTAVDADVERQLRKLRPAVQALADGDTEGAREVLEELHDEFEYERKARLLREQHDRFWGPNAHKHPLPRGYTR